jgi:hypothetical protein
VSTPIDKRLLHVVTKGNLATILAPTYASAQSVDEEEAHGRLTEALEDPQLRADLYAALIAAVTAKVGPGGDGDAVLDKLSKGIAKRATRVKAAPASGAVAAVMVRINLLLELAPVSMRAALETDKGKAVVASGFAELAKHLVEELLR